MSDTVISVENLGKKYIIGHQQQERYTALRDVIANGVKSFGRKLLKPVGNKKEDTAYEEFWALKDVSFEVKRGDRVGIIGRNGAGKSTLLKVLSRITEPTKGQIHIKGRVASLLEVGTGFHPELTGRENIYLNGAVLGMSKVEITKKFDEIVAFAEVEKFLDTPVKRYSSGMYVRLAFAVAAHLEPEILVVDEVLAVGDAQFQKKCLGKMEHVAKEGRTVLFVSHNMLAIKSLCRRAILLKEGKVVVDAGREHAIANYIDTQTQIMQIDLKERHDRYGTGQIRFTRVWVEDRQGERIETCYSGQEIFIVAEYQTYDEYPIGTLTVAFALKGQMGEQLTDLWSEAAGVVWENPPLSGKIVCRLPRLPLNAGRYTFNVCGKGNSVIVDWVIDAIALSVVGGDFFGTGRLPDENQGNFLLDQQWALEK